MAGGKNAEIVPCMICLSDNRELVPATREVEGDESDSYRCERGHSFSMDWAAGEAEAPMWPPSETLREAMQGQKKSIQGA